MNGTYYTNLSTSFLTGPLKDAPRFKPYNPERVWWTAYFTRIPGAPFGNIWASNAPQP
jgi:hypothetical protein